MKRTIAMLLVCSFAFFSGIAFIVSLMGQVDKETAALLNGFAIGALVAGPCGAIVTYLAILQMEFAPDPPVRESIIVVDARGNMSQVFGEVVKAAGSYSRAMEMWRAGQVKVIE